MPQRHGCQVDCNVTVAHCTHTSICFAVHSADLHLIAFCLQTCLCIHPAHEVLYCIFFTLGAPVCTALPRAATLVVCVLRACLQATSVIPEHEQQP